MVIIALRVATLNIAFPASRKAALIEPKSLQYTTLSEKLPHCTLKEIKAHVFTSPDVPDCLSKHCADQKQHSNPDFNKI